MAQPEPTWSKSDIGQLLSWISDTLDTHDHDSKSFLQAINLIATLDNESITGIFGNEEEELTPEQKRVFELAKALSSDYGKEGTLGDQEKDDRCPDCGEPNSYHSSGPDETSKESENTGPLGEDQREWTPSDARYQK